MRRQPVIRRAGKRRRLGCGHWVESTDYVASMGKMWLCVLCEPWGLKRSHAEILAEARDRDWDASPQVR